MKARGRNSKRLAMALAGLAMWAGAAMAQAPEHLKVTPVLQGSNGDYARGVVAVAHTAKGWERAMKTLADCNGLLYGSTWSADDLKKRGVRWGAESLVLVGLGPMPTSEWSVSVEGLEPQGRHLTVVVRLLHSPALQAESSPYLMARIPAGYWDSVSVRYDVVQGPDLLSLGAEPALAGAPASDAAPAQLSMTWGGLKATYR